MSKKFLPLGDGSRTKFSARDFLKTSSENLRILFCDIFSICFDSWRLLPSELVVWNFLFWSLDSFVVTVSPARWQHLLIPHILFLTHFFMTETATATIRSDSINLDLFTLSFKWSQQIPLRPVNVFFSKKSFQRDDIEECFETPVSLVPPDWTAWPWSSSSSLSSSIPHLPTGYYMKSGMIFFNLLYLNWMENPKKLIIVTFADSYLMANIEFRNKACTLGKYYSYIGVYLTCSYLYMCTGIYTLRHVLAVALASLP